MSRFLSSKQVRKAVLAVSLVWLMVLVTISILGLGALAFGQEADSALIVLPDSAAGYFQLW